MGALASTRRRLDLATVVCLWITGRG